MSRTKVVEKIGTHILRSITFIPPRKLYGLRNIVEPDRPQMTVWHMHIASWLPKATNTLSEYVILIVFPQQQWLHDRAPVLLFTCIASYVLSELH
jgi:hypothetical protein